LALSTSNNNEQYKLLADWVLDYSQRLLKLKHKIEQQKHLTADGDGGGETTTATAVTSPSTSQSEEQNQKEKRKNQIAEKSRAKVMAKLNKQQKNFIETYKDLYEETKTSSSYSASSFLETQASSLLNEMNRRYKKRKNEKNQPQPFSQTSFFHFY
jgi:hypothetical protein